MLGEVPINSHIQEYAVECLLVEKLDPCSVVALIARKFPETTGLEMAFFLVSIANNLSNWQSLDASDIGLPAKLFEACSVLSADLYALEVSGISPATCLDLVSFWGGSDPYFPMP